jgi:DNA repair and recombination protein RAD54B
VGNTDALDTYLLQYALKKKAQLAALGEWTHINGLRRGSRDRVQDEILQSLMYDFDPDQPQDSGSNTTLPIDSTTTIEIPADRTPGGTISFIFERFSAAVEKGNDSEPVDEGSS